VAPYPSIETIDVVPYYATLSEGGIIMVTKRDRKKAALSIEEQYNELFQPHPPISSTPLYDESSLEQPSPLRVVPSVTTYDGAYKEPIVGA
jgi:hypothetical protein